MKFLVSIVGDRDVKEGDAKYDKAFRIPRALVDHGYRIVTGGIGSMAKVVYKGARTSSHYREGVVLSIVPGFDPSVARGSSDIQIATGLDEYRNLIVANSDAIVAIGGGAGTLSEIALAWSLKRLIICMRVDGWSGRLAGKKVDERIRYPEIRDDQCFPADNEDDVLDILSRNLPVYCKRHQGIPTD
jgi:uncharacterized protein (TIGR00725 family)